MPRAPPGLQTHASAPRGAIAGQVPRLGRASPRGATLRDNTWTMTDSFNVLHHLNQNSGAYVTVATIILVLVTAWYAWFTRSLVKEAQEARKTQKALQEQQLKQDLWQKRLIIYDRAVAFLREFGPSVDKNRGRAAQLLTETKEAEFLFEPKVSALIVEIYRNANQWCDAKERLDLSTGVQERQPACEDLDVAVRWLQEDAFDSAQAQFRAYLKLW
jgi:hypothetical protein